MHSIEALKALADESRLRIVNLLRTHELNVQEITAILDLSQPTVSHHIKILQSAGIVQPRKEGTWCFYALLNGTSPASPGNITREIIQRIETNTSDPCAKLFQTDFNALQETLNRRRDQAKKYFDSVAKKWRTMREEAHGQSSYISELIKNISNNETFLELGCGSGVLLELLTKRKGATIGVDSSQAMLDEARSALGKNTKNIDLRLGYLEHLPVGDESIDTIGAYRVFHHIPDPKSALRDSMRVLKPGGRIIIIDFTQTNDTEMIARFGELWHSFSEARFTSWVKEVGFSNVRVNSLGSGEAFLLEAFKRS